MTDASADATPRRERLAQRRKTIGLTQETLASLLGVERSTVMRWERGETAPAPWIRPKLAKALRVSAGRLEELLALAGPDGPAGAEESPTAAPRQLPAAVADFTGRAAELAALTQILDDAAGVPGTVVISAIGGTAGVGKTALALHWGHRAAHQFPDGQLYVNLRGFDLSGVPAAPAEAIHGFLTALGVQPDRIPASQDAAAALYRSLVADKRMLIVLDNARDEQQVHPLLPASPASLVVITSRNQLAGLAAAASARLVALDVLTQDEAVQLLIVRIGHVRAAAEPDAIAEIATLCACLPLALAVTAARAAARPDVRLATLAAELRDAGGRLDFLDVGDPAVSVAAVFSWSYQQLGTAAARMFRLLGLHPGPDIGVRAAASLASVDEPQARRLLRELARDCLITEHAPGRYAFHDLLRAYADSQARDRDSQQERDAAIGRVLDHYLHTAGAAALLLQPGYERIELISRGPSTAPERVDDEQRARGWFDAEHQVLLAAVVLAAESGFACHAWQLAWALFHHLARRGHFQEQVNTQRTALNAATRLDDTPGQAISSRLLAYALITCGYHDEVPGHLASSLKLYRKLGNLIGEAKVHQALAGLAERQSSYAAALGHAEQSLRLFSVAGDQTGEGYMLNAVGWYHGLVGDYQQAGAFCRKALTLATETGNVRLEGYAWDSLGYAEHHLGNFGEAAACYQRALDIFRDLRDRFNEAETLANVGDNHQAHGEPALARQAWQLALEIFDETQHPDASKVRAKLAGTDD